jgi:hypothetical protein
MQGARMNFKSFCLFIIALSVVTSSASGQYRSPSQSSGQQARTVEISPYGGYLWSQSVDVGYDDEFGKLDAKSGPIWGIEADIDVMPGGQAVLLYQRQETELTYQPNYSAKQTVGDVAIEYWQVGALGGTRNGNIMPFGLFTLGATRIIPKFVGGSDVWKFSIIFGVGAKIYLTERIGLRVQGLLPWIITSGSAAISCGGGGCYTAFGGTGIVQAVVSAGLIFIF